MLDLTDVPDAVLASEACEAAVLAFQWKAVLQLLGDASFKAIKAIKAINWLSTRCVQCKLSAERLQDDSNMTPRCSKNGGSSFAMAEGAEAAEVCS